MSTNKKYNLLYETKNTINGKIYRGAHSTDVLGDGYLGSGERLKRSILKYGRENFERTDLFFFDSCEQALQQEKYFVDEEFIKRDDVYNLNIGGDCPPSRKGCIMSNIAKEKIRAARLGKKRTFASIEKSRLFHVGSKRSEECKAKMRMSHLGKTIPSEIKEKMKQSQIKRRINENLHRDR